MFTQIIILTALIFSSTYPLAFWLSIDDPLKDQFHKFHIGLANFVAGVAVVFLLLTGLSLQTKLMIIIWKISLLSITNDCWKKDYPSPFLLSIPCLLGIFAFIQVQKEWIGMSPQMIFMGILGGLILSAAIFSMNLGHWYLNVHGLPVRHLKRAMFAFWILVAIRAIWDFSIMSTGMVVSDGDIIPLYAFVKRMDGFMLLIALFFGTLFPLVSLYFVKGTLDVKSTQSATGILYVILSSVLIGDLTYKYYLVKFGLIL